jgi:hypothetical protein
MWRWCGAGEVRESASANRRPRIGVRESASANHPGDKSPGWDTKPRERGSRSAGEFRIAESIVIVRRGCGRRGHARVCRKHVGDANALGDARSPGCAKARFSGLSVPARAFMPGMIRRLRPTIDLDDCARRSRPTIAPDDRARRFCSTIDLDDYPLPISTIARDDGLRRSARRSLTTIAHDNRSRQSLPMIALDNRSR